MEMEYIIYRHVRAYGKDLVLEIVRDYPTAFNIVHGKKKYRGGFGWGPWDVAFCPLAVFAASHKVKETEIEINNMYSQHGDKKRFYE